MNTRIIRKLMTGAAILAVLAGVIAGASLVRPSTTSAATFQTISFPALPAKTYGDAPFALTATATSDLTVTFTASGKCTIAGNILTLTGAGSCTVTAAQAGNATYAPAIKVTNILFVNPATLTITANSKTRVYKAANPPLDASFSGFVGLETPAVLSGTLKCTAFASSLSPVGSYPIACSGLRSSNYNIVYVDGTLSITSGGQSITFAAIANKVYGASPFTVSAKASSGLFVTLSTSGPCTVPANSFFGPVTITGVGTCTVFADQAGDSNVGAAPQASQSFDIAAAPLTIKADNKFRGTGQPDPAFTVSYSGFKAGDTQFTTGIFSGTLNCTTTADANSAAGPYPITCSGVTSANYNITFTPGTLTVFQSAGP